MEITYPKTITTKGYQLDKDILIEGNKIYSPETCMWVTLENNVIKAAAKTYKFINPEGIPVMIYNLRSFCKEHKLCESIMCGISTGSGKQKSYKGWTIDGEKKYKFIDATGEVVGVHNLKSFCEERNLNRSCMSKINTGIQSSHKGYTRYIPSEQEE